VPVKPITNNSRGRNLHTKTLYILSLSTVTSVHADHPQKIMSIRLNGCAKISPLKLSNFLFRLNERVRKELQFYHIVELISVNLRCTVCPNKLRTLFTSY